MKIAFISTMAEYPRGGSEELWSQTALRLAATGIDVKVNVPKWPNPPKDLLILKRAGCEITYRNDHPLEPRNTTQQFLRMVQRYEKYYCSPARSKLFP